MDIIGKILTLGIAAIAGIPFWIHYKDAETFEVVKDIYDKIIGVMVLVNLGTMSGFLLGASEQRKLNTSTLDGTPPQIATFSFDAFLLTLLVGLALYYYALQIFHFIISKKK